MNDWRFSLAVRKNATLQHVVARVDL